MDPQDRVSRRRSKRDSGKCAATRTPLSRGSTTDTATDSLSIDAMASHCLRMLATLEEAPLEDESLVYEPKYDGIRAIVELDPAARRPFASGRGSANEKTAQFPDLVAALTRYGKKLKGPVVLDGEIVALDDQGEPAGFQRLQNRIHLTESHSRSAAGRVAFIAFDVLRDRGEDLRPLPLTARRARLERIFRNSGSPILRVSEVVPGDGRALVQTRARAGMGRAHRQRRRSRSITRGNGRTTGGS